MARSRIDDRPKPGVAFAADDNRVPELESAEVLRAVLRHAGAWLLHGRPAGAGRIGLARPTAIRVWWPWFILPAIAAGLTGVFAAAWPATFWLQSLLWIICAACAALTIITVLAMAAIAHTLPPPRRHGCEEATLPTGEARPESTYGDPPVLVEYVNDQVWICERPLCFYGMAFGARMTVLRLENDALLIHSPVELDPALERAVRNLGHPTVIVAPNVLHHLYVGDWRKRFPDAQLVAAPGLIARRPDLAPALEPDRAGFAWPWSTDLVEAAVFEGHSFHREIALFHAPSSTLVLADMLENLGHPGDALSSSERMLLDLAMMSGRPTPPTDYKLAVDREALRRSLDPMFAWRFERIILSHGRLIEHDAREIFRDAFAFTM